MHEERLTELLAAVERDAYALVRHLLRESVYGYVPDGEMAD